MPDLSKATLINSTILKDLPAEPEQDDQTARACGHPAPIGMCIPLWDHLYDSAPKVVEPQKRGDQNYQQGQGIYQGGIEKFPWN